MPLKQKYKNNLALTRKKNALEQKQVAALLGLKTSDQISRYERRIKLPSLKTALELQIIYRVPVHILFYGYYEACLNEIKKRGKNFNSEGQVFNFPNDNFAEDKEFCTFIEKLKQVKVKDADLDKARSHATELIRIRAEKMNHL